jgi:hypothetical protein
MCRLHHGRWWGSHWQANCFQRCTVLGGSRLLQTIVLVVLVSVGLLPRFTCCQGLGRIRMQLLFIFQVIMQWQPLERVLNLWAGKHTPQGETSLKGRKDLSVCLQCSACSLPGC